MTKFINGINADEYYKSEQWKLLRDLCFQMVGYVCQRCGHPGRQLGGFKTLQAHHNTYDRFGCEELEDLECVCVQCHRKIHKRYVEDEE